MNEGEPRKYRRRVDHLGEENDWAIKYQIEGIRHRVFFAVPGDVINLRKGDEQRRDTLDIKYNVIDDIDLRFVFEALCKCGVLKRSSKDDHSYVKKVIGFGNEALDSLGLGYIVKDHFKNWDEQQEEGRNIENRDDLEFIITRRLARVERETRYQLRSPDYSDVIDRLVPTIADFIQVSAQLPLPTGRSPEASRLYRFMKTQVLQLLRFLRREEDPSKMELIASTWASQVFEALRHHRSNFDMINRQFAAERASRRTKSEE